MKKLLHLSANEIFVSLSTIQEVLFRVLRKLLAFLGH